MAEKQTAEEDDDEGFGDFKFAPSPSSSYTYPNLTVHSSQINGANFFSSSVNDDDEWGDFVNNSSFNTAQSDLSSGLAPTGSQPSLLESDKKQWVKPQGALPLSIFGDFEEEEKEGSGVPGASDSLGTDSFDGKRVDSVTNGSGLKMVVEINDVLGNLYTPNEQVNGGHESNFSSKGLNSNSNSNGFVLDLNSLNTDLYSKTELLKVENDSVSRPNGLDLHIVGVKNDFDDDDGWEFQGAISENAHMEDNLKRALGSSEVAGNASIFGNGASGSTDLFALSNGVSYTYSEFDIGFNKPSTLTQNDFIMNLHSKTEQNNNGNGLNPRPVVGNVDSDESFWGFEDAISETESKAKPSMVAQVGLIFDSRSKGDQNENGSGLNPHPIEWNIDSDGSFWEYKDAFSETESKDKPSTVALGSTMLDSHSKSKQKDVDNESSPRAIDGNIDSAENSWEFKDATPDSGTKHKANKSRPDNQNGAIPLSLFEDEDGKMDADNSFNLQDIFARTPLSNPINGTNTQSSGISFDDLILNLYSQADKAPSVNSTQRPAGNDSKSPEMVFGSNLVNGDDDFDDNSWEFKGAFADASYKEPSFNLSSDDAHQNVSNKLKVGSHVEFYAKLKEESYHLACFHLVSLKKVKSAAALSGEDAKVAALDKEIQEAYMELHLENINTGEVYTDDSPPRNGCLNEFLEILHEPNFQVLESEYNLSRTLSLAEKDLKSTIELFGHATSMLRILTLVSKEDQSNYISTWSRMISVCAQELKNGASIWKQSLRSSIHHQIISESRGQGFFLALAEIYRVVEILGASVRLYKPWTLSLADPESFFCLLEDCSDLWSSSGLEEALKSIPASIGFDYEGTAKALLESIKHVHGLDALVLQTCLAAKQGPLCQLSLLSSTMVPDMRLEIWNGEHYFLKLANLWANLISRDPPELPHIHAG